MGKLWTIFFYLVAFCSLTVYLGYVGLREHPTAKLFHREIKQFLKEVYTKRVDAFLSVNDEIYNDLVVNTSTCKIPNFDPFDPMTIPFVHTAELVEDCRKIYYAWTYREGLDIVFNETGMKTDGYKFKDVYCCFKLITRVEQSLDEYDENFDNVIKYSECFELSSVRTSFTQPEQENVMIECFSSKLIKTPATVLYRGFHAIAQKSRSQKTIEKIQKWKKNSTEQSDRNKPPNILIIGTDTTSRLNFRRNMIKTVSALESLGAIEMKGYTKTGEGTRSNFCVWISGYTCEELDTTCQKKSAGKKLPSYDNCPFIWKRLDEAGYLTSYSEDWPDMYAMNYVKQHVDYYLRTLMNAAHDFGLPFPLNQFIRLSTQWCIGHQTNDGLLTDYTEAVLDMAIPEGPPLFSMIWSALYPHNHDHNLIQLVDNDYADFLNRLETKGHLDNTILFFISDHGQRYGPLRETLIGWYEDRLPNFWVYLPPKIKQKHPDFAKAMEVNSVRLTTTYTLYWTLNYILDNLGPKENGPGEPKGLEGIPRKFSAQHFFAPVPSSNSCGGIGIPEIFCVCNPLKQIKELDDPLLIKAANEALVHLNRGLPEICAPLGVLRLNGGAMIERLDGDGNIVRYVVGIITTPGEMFIEAQINYFRGENNQPSFFDNTSVVQRANKIAQGDIKCLNGDKAFQLYCYCK